jgi:hypothetical protein
MIGKSLILHQRSSEKLANAKRLRKANDRLWEQQSMVQRSEFSASRASGLAEIGVDYSRQPGPVW